MDEKKPPVIKLPTLTEFSREVTTFNPLGADQLVIAHAIQSGCMQRMADALELMAAPHQLLLEQIKALKQEKKDLNYEILELKKTIRGGKIVRKKTVKTNK